jgi:SRSO17 transposase
VKTTEDAAVAAAHSIDIDQWRWGFDEVMGRIAPRFVRCEPLRNAGALMLGLVSNMDRKNCWTLAELSGHGSPDRLQHLLSRAKWDAEKVRDDLRAYVVDHLGDQDGVLVVDETGDVKKGRHTVGTQRQYTGTAGRIENAQVAVYLTYAAPGGHTPIDRELYLPTSWVEDPARRERAGVPDEVEFATKPELAGQMITRAVRAGTPARWATGDEVYGADPDLRVTIAGLGVGYVLAVGSNRTVTTATQTGRVDALTASLPRRAWRRVSAGAGAKGHRWYSWALVEIAGDTDSGHHHLLVRRNDKTGELAYYRCYSPDPVELADYVRVAGWRWKIEETFQTGKGLTGLDEHQVRTWTSWHRWVTLAILAHAFLVVTTAAQRRAEASDRHTRNSLITLTVNEFRRLFITLLLRPLHAVADILAWSIWRRRHQARARACHYRRHDQHP